MAKTKIEKLAKVLKKAGYKIVSYESHPSRSQKGGTTDITIVPVAPPVNKP